MSGNPNSLPHRQRVAGQTSQSFTDAHCAALARRAERIDQIAAYAGELAERARGRVVSTQRIIDRLRRA
jgi:hypothetical protein